MYTLLFNFLNIFLIYVIYLSKAWFVDSLSICTLFSAHCYSCVLNIDAVLLNLTFNILTSFSKNFLCTNVLQTFSHHNLFCVAKTKVDYSVGTVSFLSLAFHVVFSHSVLFCFCFVFWYGCIWNWTPNFQNTCRQCWPFCKVLVWKPAGNVISRAR